MKKVRPLAPRYVRTGTYAWPVRDAYCRLLWAGPGRGALARNEEMVVTRGVLRPLLA